jgi:SAM-dependent methyltransferase
MTLAAKRFFALEAADADPALESAFFSALKMRNGTFKLTRPSRFAAVDEAFGPLIRERLRGACAVLDIGASTGLTTIELAESLEALGAQPKIVATDLFIDAHLVELGAGVHVLADPEGWPLQYDVGGLGIRAWVRRLDYVTLAVLPRLLARSLLQGKLRQRIDAGETQPVRMESRQLHGRPIQLVQSDVFEFEPSFEGRFDFIRAANILNLCYFAPERIRLGLANITRYCRGAGALLLVVKTGGTQHDGTLFELQPSGRFVPLARIGRGSEIEAQVTGEALAPEPRRQAP